MTQPIVRWRSRDDTTGITLTSAPVAGATLSDLLDSGASSGPPLVSFHPLFASELHRLHHVAHPYIHLAIATARDGTTGEGSSTEAHRALATGVFEVMERTFGLRPAGPVIRAAQRTWRRRGGPCRARTADRPRVPQLQ